MEIRKADRCDAGFAAALSLKLWPEHTQEEMCLEFDEMVQRSDAALFLAWDGERSVGFAQCQLRRDYVEGTSTSPVCYLEGIYVEEACRNQGCARALLTACENWARQMGCREFASDCELDNTQSLYFHLQVGFAEAGRNIHFRKGL